jgi:molybdate transport system ATP-binding protein
MSAGLAAHVSLRLGTLDLDAGLEVGPGETLGVLGPNGAGKTTLLRALAGLHALTRGAVSLDGLTLEEAATGTFVAPEDRSVGVVFQDPLLFPNLSALDNVAFGLRARGARRSAARREAEAWLSRIGLSDHSASRPAQLSGGQAQRVALARALATRPRLLLLDEPLAALDATARPAMRRELRRQLTEHEGVRVLVTHDPLEAAALADRLLVLEAGKVVQTGTAGEISRRPRSRYVADLVGVNLLRGRAGDGTASVTVEGGSSLVVADPPEGDVLLVVHPRAIVLHARRPEGTARNVWPTVVEGLDRAGDRVRVTVGAPLPMVAEVTQAAVHELGLGAGVPVWMAVKATEITVFPA